VNRMAGVEDSMNIKTCAMKQEVAHVPAPIGLKWERVGCVISDGDIGCYSRPEVGDHVLIGSEDPDCDPQEWVDPDEFYAGKGGHGRDNVLTEGQWKAQCYRLGKRIPTLQVPNQPKGVVDLYDCSDDWIPIYDKSDLPGFYMAIGTSGNQYKNATVVGRMMAELIDACEHGLDHDKDPFQFTFHYTKRSTNVGFFSRKREINTNSSFSVNG